MLMQSSATLGLVLLFYLKCDVLNSVFGAICDYKNKNKVAFLKVYCGILEETKNVELNKFLFHKQVNKK